MKSVHSFIITYSSKMTDHSYQRLYNKDQSKLARSGIASFVFARRQQQFAVACFGWEFNPQNSTSLGGLTPIQHGALLDLIRVRAKWHVNLSNGLSRMHECVRQTDDRRTDHTTEKCVGIDWITCRPVASQGHEGARPPRAKQCAPSCAIQ